MACTGVTKRYSSASSNLRSSICHLQFTLPISLLENGQIVVRNLQDNARHGRAVIVAEAVVPPRARIAITIDAVEQLVSNGRVPLRPVLAASRPHGLGGIVVAVIIMEVDLW